MSVVWLNPGDLDQRTGGTLYNVHLIERLPKLGWPVDVVCLPGSWPLPTQDQLEAIAPKLASLPAGRPIIADGLLWTGLGPLLPMLSQGHPCIVLVHSPLFREDGTPRAHRETLRDLEATALAFARSIIATGGPTARDVGSFGHACACIEPGVHPAPIAPALNPHALLIAATVTPRKGYPGLLRALAELSDLPWNLRCAGSLTRAPDEVALAQRLVHELGLQERVNWLGELNERTLDQAYSAAGLYVQNSHYEAYGMSLTEAIARGLPVVSTAAGALEGLCAEAALIVEPGDSVGLAAAIREALGGQWMRLRAGALRAREQLPTWDDTATRWVEQLEQVTK